MALEVANWPGRKRWQYRRLRRCIQRNCTCKEGEAACPAHLMLYDGKTLQHLAFIKALEDETRRFWIEEWNGHPPQES